MKIAAISDVHGNLGALDAVLADIAAHDVDVIVNLGDILSGALFPCETADRLIPLALPTIRGNHERQVLTQDLDRMSLSDRHAATRLRPDQKAWIAALPETLRLSEEVLLVHGTPTSDLIYFLETVEESGLRPATTDEVKARAGPATAGSSSIRVASVCRPTRMTTPMRTRSKTDRRMPGTPFLSEATRGGPPT